MVERVGFRVLNSLGNNGTFYYPKLNLVATALIKKYRDFSTAVPGEVELIKALRLNPNQVHSVIPYEKTKPIDIQFNLELPDLFEKMIRNSA